jgi:hypothetical protein
MQDLGRRRLRWREKRLAAADVLSENNRINSEPSRDSSDFYGIALLYVIPGQCFMHQLNREPTMPAA